MPTPINNNSQYFQIRGDSSFLSKNDNALSRNKGASFGDELNSALSKLSQMENTDKLREDAILNGKAIIANWETPSDDQVDAILQKMKDFF